MKKMSKIIALALALLMLVVCLAPLTSCGNADDTAAEVENSGEICEACGADLSEGGHESEKDYTVSFIIVTAVLVVIGVGAIAVRYFLDKKKETYSDSAKDNTDKND